MIYELRRYIVKAGSGTEYRDHFETTGLPIITRYYCLSGWWETISGTLNEIVSLYAFDSLDDRMTRREALYKDRDWTKIYIPKAMSLIISQNSTFLMPGSFSPLR